MGLYCGEGDNGHVLGGAIISEGDAWGWGTKNVLIVVVKQLEISYVKGKEKDAWGT